MLRSYHWTIARLALALTSAFGCKGEKRPDGMPELYQCSLRVLQEGTPLPGANVALIAQDSALMRWPCGGNTNEEGVVELHTYGFPGAPAGTFKVTVVKREFEGGPQTEEEAVQQMKGEAPPSGPVESFDLVDQKYGAQSLTPLSIEIKPGDNPTQDVEVGAPVRLPVKRPGT